VFNPYFRKKGWIDPYPETTGYIIPTLFDYSRVAGVSESARRAVRMADWESRVQMASGAVQGGTIADAPTPAVFNTGQVIFGWVRAFRETGDRHYLDSALRAGQFLCDVQDPDGAWRKSLSSFTATEGMSSYTYNTRSAWALVELARVSGRSDFEACAVRNLDFALKEQLDNGWYKSNCLFDPLRPLLHTIAYCIEGFLEAGAILKDERYLRSAELAATAMLRAFQSGGLRARYDDMWRPTVSYRCLTGEAQMGIVWGRLYQMTGKPMYREAQQAVNRSLMNLQCLSTGHLGIYGGITGSEPVHGRYGKFEILNWAVKFFMDSLLIQKAIESSAQVAHET
jgi:uncharacterized protein YyaL (SSP411 family)